MKLYHSESDQELKIIDGNESVKLNIKDTDSNKETEKTEQKIISKNIINKREIDNIKHKENNKSEIIEYLNILDSLKNDMKKSDNFNQYLNNFKVNKKENKEIILSNNNILIYLCIYVFGPLFVIFNLLSIYHIFSFMDALREEMIDSFAFSLLKRKREFSFFQNLKMKGFRNLPDLEIMMVSSILGEAMINTFSTFFTFILFFIINTFLLFFSIFFHYHYGEKLYYQYTISENLLLFILFLLFYIFVGAISMLSLKHYINGFNKFLIKQYGDEYEEKFNLIIISITCSFAMIGKIFMNKILVVDIMKNNIERKHFLIAYGIIFIIFYGISLIFLFLYNLIFKGNGEKNEYYIIEKKACMFLGYIFYSEKVKKIHVYGECPNIYTQIKNKDEINLKKKYFSFYKIQNTCTWFCSIFTKVNTLFFMGINVGLKFQIISLDYLFEDELEDKFSEQKCLKILIVFIFIQFLVNLVCNFLSFIIFKKCKKTKIKEQNYLLLCYVTIISSIISLFITSFFYFSHIKDDLDNYFYLVQLGLNLVTQHSLLNEFISDDEVNFLSTTSFLSFSNIIVEIIKFLIELFKWPSNKILIIIQIVFSSFTIILSILGLHKKFNIDF